jgi:glycosyltransferase involved in cell wall biosynthesis
MESRNKKKEIEIGLNMMKICFVGNSDSIHLQRWSRWFVQRGHDVHLITTGSTKINGVTTYFLKKTKGPINYLFRIIKTIRIIRRIKPQIINAHFVSGTESFAAALSGFHPFMVSVWGSDIARDPDRSCVFKIIVRYVLKHADIVHTGDEFGKDRVRQLGCDESKIIIQPLGVDLELFNSCIPLEKINKFVVLSANPWFPYRHIDILIKSIPEVIKQIKNITFIFIGGGPLEEELRNLSTKLGVSNHIVFVGRILHTEMCNYLINADILVDTYIVGDNAGGGIGVTNMEAMSCGIPLLLAERGYLKKIGKSLRDEPWYCSLVYDAGNPKDLAEKIIQLMNDQELRKKIGAKEKKIAREIGDWNKNMGQIERLMLDMIKNKS